jgi:DNA-binding PadR family transcriptional regulator
MTIPVPDEVILGLLKSKPTYGYELIEVFNSKADLGRMWTMSTSQIYAVLKRLEKQSAIEGRESTVANAPARKIYTITRKGNICLENWLKDSDPSSSIHLIRVIFISRIYIASLLGYPTGIIINNQRKALIAQLSRFVEDSESAKNSIEGLTISFVVGQIKAALLWLDECENTLNSEK